MAREQAVITKGVGSDHRSRPAAVVQLAHRLHAVVQEIRRRGAIVLPCAEPVAIISSCQRRPVRRHPVLGIERACGASVSSRIAVAVVGIAGRAELIIAVVSDAARAAECRRITRASYELFSVYPLFRVEESCVS